MQESYKDSNNILSKNAFLIVILILCLVLSITSPLMVKANETVNINMQSSVVVDPANHVINALKNPVIQTQTDTVNPLRNYSPFINLAGAEFGDVPGVMYQQYIYPTESLSKLDGGPYKGIRLPFKWERMQPQLYGEFSAQEVTEMRKFLDEAHKRNLGVILDLHNYFERKQNGQVYKIGTKEVSFNAFAYFWEKMAIEFKDHPAVIAYGLMNEPHDTNGQWPPAAQKAIEHIRVIDKDTPILVSGDDWSGAHSWNIKNSNLHHLSDPSGKLIFEAHQYFDPSNTGFYHTPSCVSPSEAIRKVQIFGSWLKENNLQGFIGEYNVPVETNCMAVLEQVVRYFETEQIPHAIWAGGPWWGNYVISVEKKPNVGTHAPQTEIVKRVLGI